MPFAEELYQIADELRAVASAGLLYADNPWNKERYEKILAASARLVGVVEHEPAMETLARFHDNLFHITPLVGAEAAVFQEDKLLLIQRQDDKLWAVPGGASDVGEILARTAGRELWEETAMRGQVTRLLGIFDSRLWHSQTKVHLYHAIFQVETDDTPQTSPEAINVGWFSQDELPPLSPGHHLRVPFLFRIFHGEIVAPYFDPVTDNISR